MNIEFMKLKKYLLVFTLIIVFKSHSQVNINSNPFWNGEIEFIDGTVKNGFIQVPNITNIKKISFKKAKKAKKENFKRKKVKSIKVTSPNGNEYLYERIAIVHTLKGNASIGKSLMLVEGKNEYVTFYIASGAYIVDKKSNEIVLIYRYELGKDFPTIGRYIRKKGSEKANMFYITGYIGGFKKAARHHLTEDKSLLEKIENKQLGKNDLPEIIATYLKTTEEL